MQKPAAKTQTEEAVNTPETKTEKLKWVVARIINEDGDLAMGHIQVPESDKRPGVALGSRVAVDRRDVQPGNPLKNGGTLEE